MVDLSNNKKSITAAIKEVLPSINVAKTAVEIFEIVSNKIGNYTAPGAAKLIERLKNSKTKNNSLFIIYNSFLAGCNLAITRG